MKANKILCMLTMITMLVTMLPSIQAAAYVDSTVRFRRVTSPEDLVVGAKYMIVSYDEVENVYYTLGDQIGNEASGKRSPVQLNENGDGTLSTLDHYGSVYPLVMELSKNYVGSENKYSLLTVNYTGGYLSAFYNNNKVDDFSKPKSKGLPIGGSKGTSEWELIFREDGTVLFRTTEKTDSEEQSEEQSDDKFSYIRFFHYTSSDMILPAFSGGLIYDGDIDLDGTGLTSNDLTKDNIPVKTYLYKEVCAHDEANLTHYPEIKSTCSQYGNYEYYYCSNCCGYLDKNKTEIKFADTEMPLAPHKNTTFVQAKEASCTEHGNIAYTKCEYCGKYFEGNSTDTQIDINDIFIPAINHSYENGVCSVCGAKVVTSYFGDSNTGDGSHKIFTAEYNGKIYAIGMPNENGMDAVEITQELENVLKASNDTAAFATFEDGNLTTGSDGRTYTPKYIKIGQNYLKNDSGKLKFVCTKENATYWRYECGYMYDDTDSKKYICLIPNNGEPYFSVSNLTEDNNIQAYVYSEKCHHKNGLIRSPRVNPTCYTNGMKEYWKCNVCDMYYSDSKGISEIWNKDDLIILALGAKDEDGDDVCDYCHKKMPVFTKVTSADEIVMQNKYILVAKFGDNYYAMAPLISDSKDEKVGSSYSKLLPAVPITQQKDGTFKYKNADDGNAFIFTTEFASECSDLDNGEIRYSLQGTVDGRVSALADQSGEFFMDTAYAKYGYRLGLNDDGTASIRSVYDEAWDNTKSGYLRFYYIGGQRVFSILESENYSGEGKPYEGATIYEKEVYLYRMTENGTVTNPNNSEQSVDYILNDASSTKDFTRLMGEAPTEEQNAAANLSTVSGMAEALKQETINSTLSAYITDWSAQNTVRLDTDVNIAVKEYKESNDKKGISSITFSLTPTMTVTDGTNKATINIDDSAFNGTKLMNVSIYVDTMEPKEIIHIKEDGTKEYFYPSWHDKVISGEAKPFSISNSYSYNWVTFSVSEFSDVIVNASESVFSIAEYELKGETAKISCPEEGEYTVVFVDYEKNKLNAVRFVSQKFVEGSNYVDKPKDIQMSVGDKIFLWEKVSNMRPCCQAYTIE